jgi:hypothetical protein
LPIAEDVAWAKWAINNRHKIVYEAGVSVYHSHNDNCRQNARRAVEFEKGLDLSTGRDRTSLLTLRQALGCAYRDLRYVLTLHDPKTNRFRLAWDCLANAYWFLKEFNR